jgi:hypothetical protein
MVFGRPFCIQDAEFEVSMVRNMEDTASRHPNLSSMEMNEYGTMENVTMLSYHKHKFKLYQLSSQVIGMERFRSCSSECDVAQKVKAIHEQLFAWQAELPAELRLDQKAQQTEHSKSPIEMASEFKALALQLAYDNVQIVLHRPLLSRNGQPLHPRPPSHGPPYVSRSSPALEDYSSGLTTPMSAQEQFSISKAQCWESAIRTSQLVNHEACLVAAIYTHAGSYIGIHLFTAAMILTIVALSKPLSSQAQEAKRAISHIVRMLGWLENRILLSRQSVKILESLVQLILEKEMKAILLHNKTGSQGQLQGPHNGAVVLDRASNGSPMGQRSMPLGESQPSPHLGQGIEPSHTPRYNDVLAAPANTSVAEDYSFDDHFPSAADALQDTDFQEALTNVQQCKCRTYSPKALLQFSYFSCCPHPHGLFRRGRS